MRASKQWRDGGRIDRADEELLLEGLRSYGRSTGVIDLGNIDWRIRRSLERAHSSVFCVDVTLNGELWLVCYLKTFRVPPDRPDMETRLHDRVVRTRWLADKLMDAGDTSTIGVSQVLASDPVRLAIVFLAVGGDPLGTAWSHLVKGHPRTSRADFRRVGQAIREIESISIDVAEPSPYLNREKVVQAMKDALPFVERWDSQTMLERVDVVHHRYLAAGPPSYFCHGDINHSNVLLDRDRVYLIDFDLTSRPITFDLSVFLLRLELERPAYRNWTRAVEGWVTEGYGIANVRSNPAFALVRLIKLSDSITAAARRGDQRKLRRYASILEESLNGA